MTRNKSVGFVRLPSFTLVSHTHSSCWFIEIFILAKQIAYTLLRRASIVFQVWIREEEVKLYSDSKLDFLDTKCIVVEI